jgi:hypothetical protein
MLFVATGLVLAALVFFILAAAGFPPEKTLQQMSIGLACLAAAELAARLWAA